jgi:4-amino-4-deoxy-L-arabinose transferase-like glycosyltransferase
VSARAPRWAWTLALLAACSSFWSLGHPLVEVDDARYAEVPREMAQTGDWGTPTLNYMDYVEKPPLWYWLAASSYKIFGVGEAQARLPLALLSLLGLMLTAWLGRWLFDETTGLLGAAALGSAALWFFLSHYITLDLLLSVTLLAETAFILRVLIHPEDARWAAPAAWTAAALAFLSKGLVSVVLPGAWAAGLFLLFPQWRRPFLKLLNPLGAVLFAAITLPWFFLMEERHPGFLHFFFTEQHFQRYLTPKYNRVSPWWFFLVVLPAGMLPWAPSAAAAVCRKPKAWRENPLDAALALWVLVVLGFFSTSSSKLATYILPVAPHLSLLAVRAAQRGLPGWAAKASTVLGLVFVAAGCAAPFLKQVPPQALPWATFGAWSAGAGLILGGLVSNARARVTALALGGLALGATALVSLNRMEAELSARRIAAAVMERARPIDSVWAYNVYLHGLPFYLKRPIDKIIYFIGELHYAKRNPANEGKFDDDDAVVALPQAGKRTFVVLPTKEARHFIALTAIGAIRHHANYGRWELVEFNAAEEMPPVPARWRRRK